MFKLLTVFFTITLYIYSLEISSYIRSWPMGSFAKETAKGNYFNGDKIKTLNEITVAFAKLKDNGEIFLVDIEPDSKGYYGFASFKDEFKKIKNKNPATKITLAIGGWGAEGFSDLGVDNKKFNNFIKSVMEKIKQYNFDGIEINWLYPVDGGNGTIKARPEDKETFTKLMKELRKNLDSLTVANKKKSLLTFGMSANRNYIKWVDLPKVVNYVDYVTLQAYDYDFSSPNITAHSSALYGSKEDISTSSFVEFFLKNGIPKEKLVIGVPLYGKIWKGVTNINNGLSQPYEKLLYPQGISYDLIKKLVSFGFREKFDDKTKNSYIYENNTFISYENEKSLKAKVDYAKSLGLRGLKFWEYGDNYDGDLIEAIYKYSKN